MPSLLKMMAEMGLNISPFQAGLNKAKNEAQSKGAGIGQAFSGAINRYFGVAALVAFGSSMVRRVSEIQDLSEQFQITTDDVQNFGKAFEDSGLKAEDAGKAIDKLNRARREAVEGNQDLRDAFQVFGIGVDELNDSSQKTADIFKNIGASIRNGNVGDKERLAMLDLMGKSGARMVESMKSLENINLNLISAEQIKEVDDAERHIREIRRELEKMVILTASKGLKGDFLGALDAAFGPGGRNLLGGAEKVRKFIEDGGLVPGPGPMKDKNAPRDFAAIKDVPGAAENLAADNKRKLFEDGIKKKQMLTAAKAQAAVEEKLNSIAFGKMDKEGQIANLRKKQADAEQQIAHQKQQHVDMLYTEEIRKENIANLTLQQLEAEEKILALQKSGGIGFDSFRKLAFAGGANPSSYAAPAQQQRQPAAVRTEAQWTEMFRRLDQRLDGKIILGGR